MFWNHNWHIWGSKKRKKSILPLLVALKNVIEFFQFLVKKGSFLDFHWTFMKFKNCFGITIGIFGGSKKRKKSI